MKTFVGGHVNITIAEIPSETGLDEVLNYLEAHPYTERVPGSGWGGIAQSSDLSESGYGMSRASTGSPKLFVDQDESPLVLSRYFIDRPRKGLRDVPSTTIEGLEAELTNELHGFDVLWAPDASLVLIATHDPKEISDYVIPAINAVLSEVSGPRSSAVTPVPQLCPNDDLFFWLLFRLWTNTTLSTDLKLSGIRTMSHLDSSESEARLLNAVSFDRPIVLTAVADPRAIFGPAKLVLTDESIGLTADIFLDRLAQTSSHVLRSYYHAEDFEDWDREVFGLRLARDTSTVLLPKLLDAYRGDASWTEDSRHDFKEWAVQQRATVEQLSEAVVAEGSE